MVYQRVYPFACVLSVTAQHKQLLDEAVRIQSVSTDTQYADQMHSFQHLLGVFQVLLPLANEDCAVYGVNENLDTVNYEIILRLQKCEFWLQLVSIFS